MPSLSSWPSVGLSSVSPLLPGTEELRTDTALQLRPHKGKSHFSQPAGNSMSNAAKDTFNLLCRKWHTATSHIDIHQDPSFSN